MPRSEKQKLKLLYLRELFYEQGSADSPLTAQQIIAYLVERGIACERKSLYDDIACLRDFGLDIVLQAGRGGGYFLANREFELPELKLLVDAVQSSRFLTSKKSLELIEKLEKLAGKSEAQLLHRNVVVTDRVKNMDESIYYAVDAINEAINRNAQVSFRYFEWGINRTRIYRHERYVASPYALIWNNEFYYLVAHSERHGLTHYRVDHMSDIRQLAQTRFFAGGKPPDLSVYGKSVFSMFSGDMTQVQLLFESKLAGVVLDRFGQNSVLVPEDDEHFSFTAVVALSDTFFGWLAQFGSKVKILHPQVAVERYRKLLAETLRQYE